jgi:DNA-binding PadR family transcriptional regulator
MALSHAILSALVANPCSGYDLAKKFDNSVGYFWAASHQQIYRELTKLEEQGFVSVEAVQQEGRPDKKRYAVTDLGQQYLKMWIDQPSDLNPIKDDLLVKLFAGHLVSKSVLLKQLKHQQGLHQERLITYQSIEQRVFSEPKQLDFPNQCRYLTLRNGIRYETDWLAWCEEALAFLSELPQ